LPPYAAPTRGNASGQGPRATRQPCRAPLMQAVQLAAPRRRVPPFLVCIVEHAIEPPKTISLWPFPSTGRQARRRARSAVNTPLPHETNAGRPHHPFLLASCTSRARRSGASGTQPPDRRAPADAAPARRRGRPPAASPAGPRTPAGPGGLLVRPGCSPAPLRPPPAAGVGHRAGEG
jgi:hypothetical protein